MAIDSSLFACSIPAGTYAAGDTVEMSCIRGPAIVRDGYGSAIMKKIFTVQTNTGAPLGYISIQNSNWIDEMANFCITSGTGANVALADNSGAIQRCGNVPLQPNSSWKVTYHIVESITTTVDYDEFALIDIDYPQVAAVENPQAQDGTPVTLMEEYNVTSTIYGGGENLIWVDNNVDVFKAGYRYLLASVDGRNTTVAGTQIGFFSIHGAAGQAGLERIVPFVPGSVLALRYGLEYSTPLVKGPMVVSLAMIGATSAADTVLMECDYIRRG